MPAILFFHVYLIYILPNSNYVSQGEVTNWTDKKWGGTAVVYRGGVGVFKPPPEILKALQNRAKLNPVVKTVKNC